LLIDRLSFQLETFWCPTSLIDIDGQIKEWPLPEQKLGKFEYRNSCGLRYEAEEMRQCIEKGLFECEVVSREESLLIARIQDKIRRQIGAKFNED
jgi:dihydrodiol dehydrogenase / D-xylose 1-dehydrogenase (NADP)